MLRPFFSFYGPKWRAAPTYPPPRYHRLIEPFAGSAGYALRYPDRNVLLIDADPVVVGTWDYLLRTSPSEILRLPDIGDDQTVDDLAVPQEARWLIGFWLNRGMTSPCRRPSAWMRQSPERGGAGWASGAGTAWWGVRARQRIASQLHAIRHWRVIHGSYVDAPDVRASWFVDPPYTRAGVRYRHGARSLDYARLGTWAEQRKGQVVVCEQHGADWLPFVPHCTAKATHGRKRAGVVREVVWTRDDVA